MLQPLMHKLASQRIILASGSPRRKIILENIGLKFEIIPSTFDENLNKSEFDTPSDYVKQTALGKAMEVAKRLAGDVRPPDLIIGADTIVTMDDKIIEKPANKQHAFDLLKMDKAGGYGIQEAGGTLISKVNGDYFNVMGFPLHKFAKHVVELHKKGYL
ncbi:hypothetical protein LSH36_191g02012 [Paralvinella palmiformis]|uniref:Maf-like protein n=1 Tax=Paralvinella palmiformis TaxID=53620 RepID=A0AAD9JQC4_9ANNE|nr:hypothetical protein LSH36_191g02012 [Paralvinella palmiformis]